MKQHSELFDVDSSNHITLKTFTAEPKTEENMEVDKNRETIVKRQESHQKSCDQAAASNNSQADNFK